MGKAKILSTLIRKLRRSNVFAALRGSWAGVKTGLGRMRRWTYKNRKWLVPTGVGLGAAGAGSLLTWALTRTDSDAAMSAGSGEMSAADLTAKTVRDADHHYLMLQRCLAKMKYRKELQYTHEISDEQQSIQEMTYHFTQFLKSQATDDIVPFAFTTLRYMTSVAACEAELLVGPSDISLQKFLANKSSYPEDDDARVTRMRDFLELNDSIGPLAL